MWKYYALLSAFFAALTAICSKLGVKDIDPNLATAVRVAFILFLVWGVVLFQGAISDVRTLDSRSLLFLLLSALTTGLSWLFYFQALACGDVSRVAPLDKLSVPFVILLSFLLLGEPLGWKVIIGGSLITAGSLVLLL